MSKSMIAALGTALVIGIATPASAEITTIDFKGVGRVTKSIMSCYYIDEDLNEICPPLSDFDVPAVGTTVEISGRYTVFDFAVADTGFSEAYVYPYSFQFSVVPIGPPAGLLSYDSGDPGFSGGYLQFNNGRITSIDVNLADEYCQGQGAFSWNRASPTSGFFGFELCGNLDSVFYDAPFYGFNAEWRMTETSINGGAWATIPEPRTWALFIIGFGGVGAAMRRQADRKAIATA